MSIAEINFKYFIIVDFVAKPVRAELIEKSILKSQRAQEKMNIKKRAEEDKRRQKRRDDINKLMAQTGLYNKYGLVAYFYDNNDIQGLFGYVKYQKSIGNIKPKDLVYVQSHNYCEADFFNIRSFK